VLSEASPTVVKERVASVPKAATNVFGGIGALQRCICYSADEESVIAAAVVLKAFAK
jgi:hypothetical protein